ncbi:hypothetical protein SAMN04487792_1046 [Lactobacillus bombicola]|uniref:Lactococcin 972 family bacteriocin n=1 Tax=Lactobacillus bombicola TaxID=1505723 RepID=A0A1I1SUG1_9LACO|nr:lactococcin 972 family bacteriocin [Lactobacillus bombicola]SFD48378.1 hypothetical protein SAMN04487792_1046 [Lactobacillus bombicola]
MSSKVPNSGYVAFDDNNKVIESSSPVFTSQSVKKSDSPATTTYSPGYPWWPHSRWVYFADHHNYFNGYKWSHSNYYHDSERHSSTAAVGGKDTTTIYAGANKFSYALAKGYGTAQAWYWAPYI